MIEAVLFTAGAGLLAGSGVILLLRRDRNRIPPHRHVWEMWSKPEETKVYAEGVRASEIKDRLPVRRQYRQTRTCVSCGMVERHRWSE